MQQRNISAHKLSANRANSRSSTGPRSKTGKMHVAQNAHRHGLSIPASSDPNLSPDIVSLANEIAGVDASSDEQNLARRIAEAQIDLVRVRQLRCELLSHKLSKLEYHSTKHAMVTVRQCKQVLRMIDHGIDRPSKMMDEISPLEGPEKFATILSDLIHELTAMDRYERRALSRRKFAIRDFDIARQARAGVGAV
jgi:hypothetical protein